MQRPKDDLWQPITWHSSSEMKHWSFRTRWYSIFRRFRLSLPCLLHFGFGEKYTDEEAVTWGESEQDSDKSAEHSAGFDYGHLNFGSRAVRMQRPPPWPAVLLPSRYMCFYSHSDISDELGPWVSPEGFEFREAYDVWKPYVDPSGKVTVPKNSYPDREGQDRAALTKLRVALRKRRQGVARGRSWFSLRKGGSKFAHPSLSHLWLKPLATHRCPRYSSLSPQATPCSPRTPS